MNTKRLGPNAIHFADDVALRKRVVPYFKRHRWSDFSTPFGWVAVLAIVSALMLGARHGSARILAMPPFPVFELTR